MDTLTILLALATVGIPALTEAAVATTRLAIWEGPGNDLIYRFTLIVESLAHLRSPACIIDGEAVCCDDDSGPAGARRATRLQRSLRRPLYS